MKSIDKTPLLSVLLPAYNVEKYIAEAIESILNQTFTDFELIIADDGSIDKTREIIDSYRDKDFRIIISHNSVNQGKNKTVNRLFQMVTGKYLTVHDSDDISELSRFEKQIRLLENTEYVMCGTSFNSISAEGEFLSTSIMPNDYKTIKENILNNSQFHGPTIIVRTDIINKVGGLYRIMKYGEDIDFSMRIVEKFQATNLQEVLYYYRINPSSLTKSSKQDLLEKHISVKLRKELAKQRKTSLDGKDSLMRGEVDKIVQIKHQIKKDFEKNMVEYIDEYAAYLLHYGLYKQAFLFVFRQWLKYPWKIRLLKIQVYILKTKFKF